MRVLCAVLLSLALAPTASAALPLHDSGEELRMVDKAVAIVAGGRPVEITCAASMEAWDKDVRAMTSGQYGGYEVHGYADLGRIRLAWWVCAHLEVAPIGEALNVVAHETAHALGVWSEAEAACWGLRWAPVLARRLYGVRASSPQSSAVALASRKLHASLPDDYRSLCP